MGFVRLGAPLRVQQLVGLLRVPINLGTNAVNTDRGYPKIVS